MVLGQGIKSKLKIKELSVVAWGPTHHLMGFSHYNRPIRRSSLGWYGNLHYKII